MCERARSLLEANGADHVIMVDKIATLRLR